MSYAKLVQRKVGIPERLEEEKQKLQAINDELPKKSIDDYQSIPAEECVTHLDLNPHYFKYEPITYKEVDDKYGLVICDFKKVSCSQ